MNELCIPLPEFLEQQIAEIEVKINGRKRQYNFRVESFQWEVADESLDEESEQYFRSRIENLRNMIESYDQDWELIQIFNPEPGGKFIQVLFRQKGSGRTVDGELSSYQSGAR